MRGVRGGGRVGGQGFLPPSHCHCLLLSVGLLKLAQQYMFILYTSSTTTTLSCVLLRGGHRLRDRGWSQFEIMWIESVIDTWDWHCENLLHWVCLAPNLVCRPVKVSGKIARVPWGGRLLSTHMHRSHSCLTHTKNWKPEWSRTTITHWVSEIQRKHCLFPEKKN